MLAANVALLASLFVAVVTVVRLYQATGFNGALTITALGVVDRTQLLLSSLLASLVMGSLAVCLVAAFRLGWSANRWQRDPVVSSRRDHRSVPPSIDLWVTAVVLSVALLSCAFPTRLLLTLMISLAVCAALGVALRVVWAPASSSLVKPGRRLRGLLTAVAAVAMLNLAASVFDLQTDEQVTVRSADGDETVVYDSVWVMGEQGGRRSCSTTVKKRDGSRRRPS